MLQIWNKVGSKEKSVSSFTKIWIVGYFSQKRDSEK